MHVSAQGQTWFSTMSRREVMGAAVSVAAATGTGVRPMPAADEVAEQLLTVSQDLFSAAGDPKRLLLVPGGHHRSLQHDGEMQAESIRWIDRSLAQ